MAWPLLANLKGAAVAAILGHAAPAAELAASDDLLGGAAAAALADPLDLVAQLGDWVTERGLANSSVRVGVYLGPGRPRGLRWPRPTLGPRARAAVLGSCPVAWETRATSSSK